MSKWSNQEDDKLICMIKERICKDTISRVLNKDSLDINQRIQYLSNKITGERYVDLKEMSQKYNIDSYELNIIFFL